MKFHFRAWAVLIYLFSLHRAIYSHQEPQTDLWQLLSWELKKCTRPSAAGTSNSALDELATRIAPPSTCWHNAVYFSKEISYLWVAQRLKSFIVFIFLIFISMSFYIIRNFFKYFVNSDWAVHLPIFLLFTTNLWTAYACCLHSLFSCVIFDPVTLN